MVEEADNGVGGGTSNSQSSIADSQWPIAEGGGAAVGRADEAVGYWPWEIGDCRCGGAAIDLGESPMVNRRWLRARTETG